MTTETRTQKLETFFKWAMWQSGDWCNDIDGADLQDKAEELGLIEQVEVSAPCCERCACAEVYGEDEFPVHCYRYVEDDGVKTND